MAVLSDLVSKVRTELNDQAKQFTKTFAGDGVTVTFPLGVKPVDDTTLLVKDNSTVLANPAGYTVEAVHGVVHCTTAPAAGHTLTVSGNVWRYFSESEIEGFVNTALLQHTSGRTDGFNRAITVASLPELEVYPLVVLSTVEALFALATDASYDIDIQSSDGVSIPRSERFRQISGLITQRMQHYRDLCSALNIGLWRIEMGTLRRVSRTTNKLVPIYMAQEIDDSTKPERVYIQNDLNGRVPVPSTVPIYDIVLQQGDDFSVILDFPDTMDFSTLTFKAQIRTYPGAPTLWATFTIEVFDALLRKLKLSLAGPITANLPVRCFWDIQATDSTDNTVTTYLRGQVFTYPQVTQ
ncbi:hypothetical protein UFOVP115_8 [uncultured Caudovirales phage]|uniref:Uncharacterized protein n=1 Tax=uncultured Caudovirales phage TaxID=2100421 RepID=A0A6J5L9D7_9CAUD|nr:hypothetical protein UFOVP115_8 [uncultured Caudovirales phage]